MDCTLRDGGLMNNWQFSDDKDLRRVVGGNKTVLKLSAMADIGRIETGDIPPAKDSVIDMLRVACYVHQIDKGIAPAEHCIDKGYEVCINLMAVSKSNEIDLDEALQDISKSRVPYFISWIVSGTCTEKISSTWSRSTEKPFLTKSLGSMPTITCRWPWPIL